mmetsp:Transcript_72443/g.155126  ORF Transcript_72443/g.155126 Transcript_72443/m.155126 type:complete len:262 (+) Transcript_72443:92-877(+)
MLAGHRGPAFRWLHRMAPSSWPEALAGLVCASMMPMCCEVVLGARCHFPTHHGALGATSPWPRLAMEQLCFAAARTKLGVRAHSRTYGRWMRGLRGFAGSLMRLGCTGSDTACPLARHRGVSPSALSSLAGGPPAQVFFPGSTMMCGRWTTVAIGRSLGRRLGMRVGCIALHVSQMGRSCWSVAILAFISSMMSGRCPSQANGHSYHQQLHGHPDQVLGWWHCPAMLSSWAPAWGRPTFGQWSGLPVPKGVGLGPRSGTCQ